MTGDCEPVHPMVLGRGSPSIMAVEVPVADIFISYAREDAARVEKLVRQLEREGLSVFWDREIPAGKSWRSHIGQALSEARCVVVAWSRHSIESSWVAEEADEGKERGALIPVLLDSVSPPIGFRSIQTADLSGKEIAAGGERLERLLGDIKAVVARVGANVDTNDEPHSAIDAIEPPQRSSGKYRKVHLGLGFAVLTVILSSVFWYRSGTQSPSPVPVAAVKSAPIPSPSRYFCGSQKFVVNAKEILDTGLLIKRGSQIQAVASGEGIKFSLDLGPGYTPAGENRIARRPFPGVGLHEYALLAQVGADFYEVGVAANFTATNDGRLRYQFNDSMLRDNQGSARVQLTVRCP